MQLTDKQKTAIFTDNKNILISAAAGSGKTSVLSMRISRLIEEGADIRRMLVCTFTNLAASEMRERISNRLRDIADDKNSIRLRAQAEYAASSDICTIHSFCLKLIKENYLNIGIPSLRIASDQLKNTIFNNSMDDAFEQMAASDNPAFIRLSKRYVKKKETDLKQILTDVYNFVMTMKEGLDWLISFDKDEVFNKLVSLLNELRIKRIKLMTQYFKMCLNLSEKNGWESQKENDIKEYESSLHILNCFCNKDGFNEAVSAFSSPNRKRGLLPEDDAKLHGDYKSNARKIFREVAQYTNNMDVEQLVCEEDYMLQQTRDIYDILKVFDEEYTKQKHQKGVATFDDILRYAYSALMNENISEEWQKRYDYIFVDEYQDTNPIQDAIIEKISKSDNRFMVGDIKQSIYRFRLADPLIFRNKQDEYDGKSDKVELIRMNDNFRSSAAVTDKINYAMTRLMNREFGEIDYSAGEELVANSVTDGRAELLLTECNGHNLFEADADTVAKKIRDIMHSNEIDYKDIVILISSANLHGDIYKNALMKYSIPCDVKQDNQSSDIVELFINLLKVIDGSSSDIALISVMRSWIGGFDEEDFAQIRINYPVGSFYDAVYLCNEGDIGEKCKRFVSSIEKFRLYEKVMDLTEFLFCIKNETLFEEMVRIQNNGLKMSENFISFFNECVSESKSRDSLFDLICYYNELKRYNQPYIPKQNMNLKNDNSVKIMTVHASKGLEFPVVFFSGIHNGIDRGKVTKKKVLYNSGLGVITDIRNEKDRTIKKSLLKDVLKEHIILENKSEHLRLCYVAMTRAKKQLYLSGSVKNIDVFLKETSTLTRDLAIENDDPLSWFTWAYCNDNETPGISIDIKKYEPQISSTENIVRIQDVLSNLSQCSNDTEFISVSASKLPLKVGVSSLLPEYNTDYFENNIRSATDVSGAKFGTLIHLFLEHVDFNNFVSVEEHLEKMYASVLITEHEKNLILAFKDKIEKFMCSSIALKIKNAKKILKEVPFNIAVKAREIGYDSDDKILVQGIIDLIIFEEEGITVIDYKSNYISETNFQNIINHYKTQMKLYRRAVELITHKDVKECILCFVRGEKAVGLSNDEIREIGYH